MLRGVQAVRLGSFLRGDTGRPSRPSARPPDIARQWPEQYRGGREARLHNPQSTRTRGLEIEWTSLYWFRNTQGPACQKMLAKFNRSFIFPAFEDLGISRRELFFGACVYHMAL